MSDIVARLNDLIAKTEAARRRELAMRQCAAYMGACLGIVLTVAGINPVALVVGLGVGYLINIAVVTRK